MSNERDFMAAAEAGGAIPSIAATGSGDGPSGESGADLRHMLHELRQPLNNIQLAAILLRNRTAPLLEGSERDYLMRRLERIEGQVARAVDIANKIAGRN